MQLPLVARFRLRCKTPQSSMAMVQVDGDSSGGEEESEAKTSARGCCGQFVWPCPREYPSDSLKRKAQKWLIPEDLSKDALGNLFKDICTKLGQGPNIDKIHVFDEPHKRYNRQTQARERHKHLLFKMKTPFAHLRIQKELAARGVYGHFSFNLVGYVNYLRYCLEPSAGKLGADIDERPWSWPPVPTASLVTLCKQVSPQMESRSGIASGRGRKRKLLDFSEVTDAFVEGAVKTEKDAWVLAKTRKVAGDDTLYNTLGSASCVRALVAKVRQAWDCNSMSTGTLLTQPGYSMHQFISLDSLHSSLSAWVQGGWRKTALIICGEGGLGKTEFACTLMHAVCSAKAFHFVNKVDRLRDIIFSPGEGLVVDEACFATRDVDDAKAMVDLEKVRDITCRNRDGRIPCGTPRIFSTNWPWEQFWPREAFNDIHAKPIQRRVLWINVKKDLRKFDKGVDDHDEDPFGNGFDMH